MAIRKPRRASGSATFKQADRARVLADDQALLGMLPPAMGADYKLLVAQLDSDTAASPRSLPDVPVALLTATQVVAAAQAAR